jgi:radical SAM superfamily enzyme YgiQ (UPF0313 family)
MWVWNSIATRKRSPSDGFLENGLAVLKGYLEERGHDIRVVDWQKNDFYNKLCPRWLLFLNRLSTVFVFWLGGKGKIYAKFYFPLFNALQEAVTLVRNARIERYLRRFGDEALKSGIKVFGSKIWYGEAFLWADWLAGYIKKKNPSILLIAGGFHTTLYEEDFLKNSVFDLAVISEGEKPMDIILGIVDKNITDWNKKKVLGEIEGKINSGELKNMAYREGAAIKVTPRYTPEMENKAFPKYERENIEGKLKIHVLLDSLGCPWGRCNFCVHSHFYPRFHPRPVENIVSEMGYMVQKGIGLFRFAGSETPPAFGVRIAKAILEKGLKVKYSIGCRPISKISESEEKYNAVVKDYETMLKAGLRAIFMGGETGNDIINEKVMNKGVNKDDIIKTAKAFREAQRNTGIRAYLSLALIYPSPLTDGISMEMVYNDNLKLIEKVAPDSVIVSPAMPFKHSVWNKNAQRFEFDISQDFVERLMRYEYVLYKPPSLWPRLSGIRMRGIGFKKMLEECGHLRNTVEVKGIPVDLTDEYFLMIEAADYAGKEALRQFKKETSIDLVSSDYRNIEKITEKTNILSQKLAESNFISH